MSLMLDSFWRALLYGLHPRVWWYSLLPLFLMVGLWLGLGYFLWEPAVDGVRTALESFSLLNAVWGWFEGLGLGRLKTVAAPLIVIFMTTPMIVLAAVLIISILATPLMVKMVAVRRFPGLARQSGSNVLPSLLWLLGSTLMALLALLISLPLWLVPPLVLVLPPLIWGWLTYRVLAFDALALHATKSERREIFRRHGAALLTMGVLTGYVSAAPSLVWASGALFAAAFVLLVPIAVWIYTLVLILSSLWFAHFCLSALQQLREESRASPKDAPTTASALEPTRDEISHDPSLKLPPVSTP